MMDLPENMLKLKQFMRKNKLPGLNAHLKMAPQLRDAKILLHTNPNNAKISSVLILLFPTADGVKTSFILRPMYDGIHSGQISFPGGKAEPSDKSSIETALREAWEEIGVRNNIEVLGTLSDLFIPPSNYLVKPVVAYTPTIPEFKIDSHEVDQLILVSVKELLSPATIKLTESFSLGANGIAKAPCFFVNNKYRIWGATAMIISELLAIMKEIGFSES